MVSGFIVNPMPTTPRLPEPLFPRLRAGRGLSPERATAHRRGRLMGAMVEAVRRHGYAETTITELVALAGVSKSAFYESFESKEACFVATFEEIVEQASERIGAAYRSRQGLRERLGAGLEAFVEIIASEPTAARLVLVDSLALGAAGVGCREQAAERFETMLAQSFAQEPQRGALSELQLRAIVAGIRRVAYRCLRDGELERLREGVPSLAEWALGYPGGAADVAVPSAPAAEVEGPGWEEPPSSPRARAELSQRERIMRAAAQLAAEGGYGSLGIPAISARAGTSNETLYGEFGSKQEAFLAAEAALSERALGVGAAAFATRESWAEGVACGLGALLAHIATEPIYARLAFFELPASGPDGLEHSDRTTEAFIAFLRPEAFGASTPRQVPEVVAEAIGGAIWAAIQHELAGGQAEALPELAPQLAAIALAPFGVA